jgi:hypothetical protein
MTLGHPYLLDFEKSHYRFPPLYFVDSFLTKYPYKNRPSPFSSTCSADFTNRGEIAARNPASNLAWGEKFRKFVGEGSDE